MQYKKGADVVNAKGNKVGSIERVVIDPRSKQITHIVVEKGWLLKTDKVLPVSLVDSANTEQIRLKSSDVDLDEFPEFEETNYLVLSERDLLHTEYRSEQASSLTYMYPNLGYGTAATWGAGILAGPADTPVPVEDRDKAIIEQPEPNIPEGTVALKEGMRVYTEDGEPAGRLVSIFTAPNSQTATHFVIEATLLGKTQKQIPIDWVKHMNGEDITLGVSSGIIERLKDYQG